MSTSTIVRSSSVESIPQWVYEYSNEQFFVWCKQHKLQVCNEVRPFPEDERTAIFRYAIRQRLVN